MCDDYRLTRYCCEYSDVSQRKQTLEALIKSEYPRTQIIYNKVSDRNLKYINEFIKIYNSRCAYCGVSNQVLANVYLFEVDHFICESSFTGESRKSDAGVISNLVLACRCCNRDKGNHQWPDEYNRLFHPDEGLLPSIFIRDELYYIQIAESYKSDAVIIEFYNKLKLGSQKRRLDYLLIEMKEVKARICHNPLNSNVLEQLSNCIERLYRLRNSMY